MSALEDFLAALLRSPEGATVEASVGGTVYQLSALDLQAAVIECIDTRYTTLLQQPPGTLWEVRPVGASKPSFTMSFKEVAHALPAYTKTAPPPEQTIPTVEMVVTANGLNVRAVPSSTGNVEIATLARGTVVTVKADNNEWKQIASGAYKGAYLFGKYLSPKA